MDRINKLGFFHKLEKTFVEHARQRIQNSAKGVTWLSYHIPKTAGTSFRSSLNDVYGKKSVYAVYEFSGAKQLSIGESIWIPRGTRILHGHFKPIPRHRIMFPNSKRIIFLRDPVKRAWSLLNHTLEIKKQNTVYNYIKDNFLDRGIVDREEIFLKLLDDENSKRFLNVYNKVLAALDNNFFHFIGTTENYIEDIKKLSELMETELNNYNLNKRPEKFPPPHIPTKTLSYFDEEYKVFERLTARK